MKNKIFQRFAATAASLVLCCTSTFGSIPEAVQAETSAGLRPADGTFYYASSFESSDSGWYDTKYFDENGQELVQKRYPSINSNKDDSYPEKFSLADRTLNSYGKTLVTGVKKQANSDCWAYAAIGAIESNMLMMDDKSRFSADTLDLSEAHLTWFSKTPVMNPSDPLYDGLLMLPSGDASPYDVGGNVWDAFASLASGTGPIFESDFPIGTNKKPSFSESYRYRSEALLKNMDILPSYDTNGIKEHLMKNGAMVCSYFKSDKYYNDVTHAYYNYDSGIKSTNHAVIIVGWDDSFSKNNFGGKVPPTNGAWICRNSYGTSKNDKGYFYLSYCEPSLRDITSFRVETDTPYTHNSIYQYDGTYNMSSEKFDKNLPYSYGGHAVSAASVYEAKDQEFISEVGFVTLDENVTLTISVYTDVNVSIPSKVVPVSEKNRKAVQTETISYPGFHTVTLKEPVSLTKGQHFSVVIDYPMNAKVLLDCGQAQCAGLSYLAIDASNISKQAIWDQLGGPELSNVKRNPVIKAYTQKGIVLNSKTFPDEQFREYINTNYNNGDNVLSDSEIKKITKLDVSNMGFKDLCGIEYFYNLTELNAAGNQLTHLNLNGTGVSERTLRISNNILEMDNADCAKISISHIDYSKISNMVGAVVDGNGLKPQNRMISYTYDCGNGISAMFEVKLTNKTHIYSGWKYDANGDCHYQECEKCGDRIENDHEYTWVHTTNGEHYKKCQVCGYQTAASQHTYKYVDEGTSHKATCSGCGYSYSTTHRWKAYTEYGEDEHQRICADCGKEEISEHTYFYSTNETMHSKTCSKCKKYVSAKHTFKLVGRSTETVHTLSCECGETKTEQHIMGAWMDGGDLHYQVCTVCERQAEGSHMFSRWSNDNAEVHSRQCSICKIEVSEHHNIEKWDVDENGVHTGSCTLCGYELQTDGHYYSEWEKISDLNHSRKCFCGYVQRVRHCFGDWQLGENNTHYRVCDDCGYTEEGEHEKTRWYTTETTHSFQCTICKKTIKNEHTLTGWISMGDEQHTLKCEVCDYEVTENHVLGKRVNDNTAAGTHSRTCKCGYVLREKHSYDVWSKMDDGENHQRTCSFCDAEEIEPHEWIVSVNKEKGQHTLKCKYCAARKTEPHKFDTLLVDNGDGQHTMTCISCDHQEVFDHEFGDFEDDGNGNHYKICQGCGLKEESVHVMSLWYGDENGTHSRDCTFCGYKETEKHLYGDWLSMNQVNHTHTCLICESSELLEHDFMGYIRNDEDGTYSCTCQSCKKQRVVNFEVERGDVNDDGVVNAFDLAFAKRLQYHEAGTVAQKVSMDMNNNGQVDSDDFKCIVNWLFQRIKK